MRKAKTDFLRNEGTRDVEARRRFNAVLRGGGPPSFDVRRFVYFKRQEQYQKVMALLPGKNVILGERPKVIINKPNNQLSQKPHILVTKNDPGEDEQLFGLKFVKRDHSHFEFTFNGPAPTQHAKFYVLKEHQGFNLVPNAPDPAISKIEVTKPRLNAAKSFDAVYPAILTSTEGTTMEIILKMTENGGEADVQRTARLAIEQFKKKLPEESEMATLPGILFSGQISGRRSSFVFGMEMLSECRTTETQDDCTITLEQIMEDPNLPFAVFAEIMQCVSNALAALNGRQMSFVHGDLHSKNVLVKIPNPRRLGGYRVRAVYIIDTGMSYLRTPTFESMAQTFSDSICKEPSPYRDLLCLYLSLNYRLIRMTDPLYDRARVLIRNFVKLYLNVSRENKLSALQAITKLRPKYADATTGKWDKLTVQEVDGQIVNEKKIVMNPSFITYGDSLGPKFGSSFMKYSYERIACTRPVTSRFPPCKHGQSTPHWSWGEGESICGLAGCSKYQHITAFIPWRQTQIIRSWRDNGPDAKSQAIKRRRLARGGAAPPA